MAKKDGTNGKKIGRHGRNPSSKMQAQRSQRNKRLRVEAALKRGDNTSGSAIADPEQHYRPKRKSYESWQKPAVDRAGMYLPKSPTPEQRAGNGQKAHADQRAWHLARAACVAAIKAVKPSSAVRKGTA